jgi:hypothetical protein
MIYYITFPVAMDRANHRVIPSDIPPVLQVFVEKTGIPADHIYINPELRQELEKSIPEGIVLEDHSGVLSWEIWLGAEAYKPAVPAILRIEAEAALDVNTSLIDPINPILPQDTIMKQRGRPRAVGILSRTTRWRRLKESLKKQEVLL